MRAMWNWIVNRLRGRHAFTLLETMIGMLILLASASVMLPSFIHDLALNAVSWERRLAMKVIESELDWACNQVATAGFDTLTAGANQPLQYDTLAPFPPELTNPTGGRTVNCVDGSLSPPLASCTGANLKQVTVRVQWSSHGYPVSGQSADYLISREGGCAS